MTAQELLSLMRQSEPSAAEDPWLGGLFIDADDPRCVCLDGYLDLEKLAALITSWKDEKRDDQRLR